MTDSTKDFTKEFALQRAKFKPWAILMIVCVLAIIVVLPILYFVIEFKETFLWIYLAAVLAPLSFTFYKTVQFARCPSCKKYMGRDISKFCSICGVQIQK